MERDLIFDVGMNNGDDTAHYLERGYRVVAVEADPTLVDAAHDRFPDAVRTGHLRIVNCGIGPRDEVADFWICDQKREWNSFDRDVAARDGLPHHAIPVRSVPFRALLDEFGTPYYLKIDIEGHDHYCVSALDPGDLPHYVSLEMGPLESMFRLRELGYTGFKLITQNDHTQLRVDPLSLRAYVKRRLRPYPAAFRVALAALRMGHASAGIARLLAGAAGKAVHPAVSLSTDGGRGQSPRFPFGSSGPFGEDTPGEWHDLERAAFTWVAYQLGLSHYGPPSINVWHDVHASLQRD